LRIGKILFITPLVVAPLVENPSKNVKYDVLPPLVGTPFDSGKVEVAPTTRMYGISMEQFPTQRRICDGIKFHKKIPRKPFWQNFGRRKTHWQFL